jgi:hypothetical protein
VAGKERDVRAEDGFDQSQNLVGEQPLEQPRLIEVGRVHCLWPNRAVQRCEHFFEQRLESAELGRRKDRIAVNQEALVAVVLDLIGRQPGYPLGHRALAHFRGPVLRVDLRLRSFPLVWYRSHTAL